jgi:hypothetical protein
MNKGGYTSFESDVSGHQKSAALRASLWGGGPGVANFSTPLIRRFRRTAATSFTFGGPATL